MYTERLKEKSMSVRTMEGGRKEARKGLLAETAMEGYCGAGILWSG